MKGGSEDRMRLRNSIWSTVSLLEMLKYRFEDANEDETTQSLDRRVDVRTPLRDLQRILETLVAKMALANRLEKTAQRITWPFNREDVSKLIASIETQQSFLSLAMQNNHMRSTQTMKGDLKEVNQGIGELRIYQIPPTEKIRTSEEQEAIEWISPIRFLEKQWNIEGTRVIGTSEWIIQDYLFNDWVNGPTRILWCPGIPGAGKTFIASVIINRLLDLQRSRPDLQLGVAYVYCNCKEQGTQTITNLFSSILHQLVFQAPEIPKIWMDTFKKQQWAKIRLSKSDVLQALRDIIPAHKKTYVIIDALDECTESDGKRSELVEELKQMPLNLKMLCTSRELPDIKQLFTNSGKIHIHARNADIEKYLKRRVEKSERLRKHVHSDLSLLQAIKDNIVHRADGMFLLAQLHVETLSKKYDRKSIRRALETLPTSLDDAYDQALQKILSQDADAVSLAKKVFYWIICARTPLKTKELRYVIAAEDLESTEENVDEEACVDEEILIGVCAGIVIADEGGSIIRLVHSSAQEYFERNKATIFPEAQQYIARACLRYLSLEKFSTPFTSYADMHSSRDKDPFYVYAANNWGYHAAQSPEKDVIKEIHEFLQLGGHVRSSMQIHRSKIETDTLTTQDYGLWVASHWGLAEVAGVLLSEGADVNVQVAGLSALRVAVEFQHKQAVRVLLDNSVAIQISNTDEDTIFALGKLRTSASIIKMVLDVGDFDIEAKNDRGESPLYVSIHDLDYTFARALVEYGASIRGQDWLGRTALHLSAATQVSTIVEMLLSEGAAVDVNTVAHSGETPLHCAASTGNYMAVKLLVEHGADVNARTLEGHTPVDKAILHSKHEIAEWLGSRPGATSTISALSARIPTTIAGLFEKQAGSTLQVNLHVCLRDYSGEAWGASFSNSGTRLAIWGSGKPVLIYETEQFDLLHTLEGGSSKFADLSWSSDDAKIMAGSIDDGFVLQWNAITGELIRRIPHLQRCIARCLWVPGKTDFVTTSLYSDSKSLLMWSEEGTLLHDFSASNQFFSCAFAPESGNIVLFGTNAIEVYHSESLLLLARKEVGEFHLEIKHVSTSPSSPYALLHTGRNLVVIHLETLEISEIFEKWEEDEFVIRSSFSHGNKYVASGSDAGIMYIWNWETRELVGRQKANSVNASCNCITWNPKDPNIMVSASDNGEVTIWTVFEADD